MKLFAVLLLVALAGCAVSENGETDLSNNEVRTVTFQTVDNWQIAATDYQSEGRPIILLHQLGQDRAQWSSFANLLHQRGYRVLALDLRGHAGSAAQDWQQFTEADFRRMTRDVDAAVSYLDAGNLSIIGASLGANVAASSGNEAIGAAVLLSPATNYRGVSISGSDIRQPTLIAASSEDTLSFSSSETLVRNSQAQFVPLRNAGHGVQLLEDEQFEQTLLDWLADNFPVAAPPPDNSTNVTAPAR